MKRFVLTLLALKLTLVVGLFTLFVAGQGAAERSAKVSPTPTPEQTNDNVSRPTSVPYNGDLLVFESEDRAKKLQIDRVMDILKITKKKDVADIGAGSGWFTVRAAKRAEKGIVYAVEINQEYIDHINARAVNEGLPNIKTVLGKVDDPMLPRKSVDVVFILKAYHEFGEPIRLMKNLKGSLRKNALVAIIDKNGSGDDHGLDKNKVIAEMKIAGYKLRDQYDFVKGNGIDYFLVFEKR